MIAALEACCPALMGEGEYVGKSAFPEQATFPSQGHGTVALRLYRNYSFRGQRRSYLSAACTAPLERTLSSTCRVSG